MTEFLFELGLFLSKALIILALLGALGAGFGSALSEHKKWKKKKKLEVEDIGKTFQSYSLKIQSFTHSEKSIKKKIKAIKKKSKVEESKASVYVLDFEGDMEASQVDFLRDEVSTLIRTADPKKDEIVLRLNNRGGMVANHGLAASQLQRLRDKNFKLTVCVDEVAGSGGYLMAAVAHKILSAPFAIIGSIGVLAQVPNFYRFLQKQSVDFEEHSAGEHKRTLTLFGKATDEKREKLKAQLEEVHLQFKNYVSKYRPNVDLEKVATGDHWLGEKAKALGLVDEIMVSDDYILSLLDQKKQVYKVQVKEEELKGLKKVLNAKAKSLSLSAGLNLFKKLFS